MAFVSQNDKFGLKIHDSCASRASIYPSYVATILTARVLVTENPGESKNEMFVLLRTFSSSMVRYEGIDLLLLIGMMMMKMMMMMMMMMKCGKKSSLNFFIFATLNMLSFNF